MFSIYVYISPVYDLLTLADYLDLYNMPIHSHLVYPYICDPADIVNSIESWGMFTS